MYEPLKSHCGNAPTVLGWRTFADGSRHIEERCGGCGAYLRWAPQTPENLERVGDTKAPDMNQPLFGGGK